VLRYGTIQNKKINLSKNKDGRRDREYSIIWDDNTGVEVIYDQPSIDDLDEISLATAS